MFLLRFTCNTLTFFIKYVGLSGKKNIPMSSSSGGMAQIPLSTRQSM